MMNDDDSTTMIIENADATLSNCCIPPTTTITTTTVITENNPIIRKMKTTPYFDYLVQTFAKTIVQYYYYYYNYLNQDVDEYNINDNNNNNNDDSIDNNNNNNNNNNNKLIDDTGSSVNEQRKVHVVAAITAAAALAPASFSSSTNDTEHSRSSILRKRIEYIILSDPNIRIQFNERYLGDSENEDDTSIIGSTTTNKNQLVPTTRNNIIDNESQQLLWNQFQEAVLDETINRIEKEQQSNTITTTTITKKSIQPTTKLQTNGSIFGTSGSIFSKNNGSLLFSNFSSSIVSWDQIIEDNTNPHDIVQALFSKVQYMDDIIPDWNDAIRPFLIQHLNDNMVLQQLSTTTTTTTTTTTNNSSNNTVQQQETTLKLLDLIITLLRKWFHMTRNNNEYMNIQIDIVEILLNVVMGSTSSSNVQSSSIEVVQLPYYYYYYYYYYQKQIVTNILDMYNDWMQCCYMIGATTDAYSCYKQQQIGVSILSKVVLPAVIPSSIIIEYDPTAKWFHRWMITLSNTQINNLLIIGVENDKQSSDTNSCSSSKLTVFGQSIYSLYQTTVSFMNTADDTTQEEENHCSSVLLQSIFILSIIRSILVVTRISEFPWLLILGDDDVSNNTNDETTSTSRTKVLLKMYCSLLRQLLEIEKQISINDNNTQSSNEPSIVNTDNDTTSSTAYRITPSTIVTAIQVCVEAIDTIQQQQQNRDNLELSTEIRTIFDQVSKLTSIHPQYTLLLRKYLA